jgi:hypothetical protein
MDAKGARELTRRLGPNAEVAAELAARPMPDDVPADALPLYRWFGGGGSGGSAAQTIEPSPPEMRPWLRRIRFRGR